MIPISRNGAPLAETVTIGDDGLSTYYYRFPIISNFVTVHSDSSCRMYFSEDRFKEDDGFVELMPDVPYQAPLAVRALWFRALNNRATVNITILPRVGL